MTAAEQLTIEDAERQWHIARLSRSLARWREQGTDWLFPDEYARYCETLTHLQAGGAYTITRFDPAAHISATRRDTTMDAMGAALAGISKRSIGMMRRNKEPTP
jgi:hypothetical protein